jgi:hypothetical protein
MVICCFDDSDDRTWSIIKQISIIPTIEARQSHRTMVIELQLRNYGYSICGLAMKHYSNLLLQCHEYMVMTVNLWLWNYSYRTMTMNIWLWIYGYGTMVTELWLRIYHYRLWQSIVMELWVRTSESKSVRMFSAMCALDNDNGSIRTINFFFKMTDAHYVGEFQ